MHRPKDAAGTAERELGKPVSTLVVRVAALCSTVAFLDGFDSTSIGVAAPLIMDKLRLSQPQLGPVIASALLGAMAGAFGFGTLADRFGRKRMLLVATLVFGGFTLATAAAGSFATLLLVRFLAGVGLGGATPCFIALVSEFAPQEHRARITSIVWTAFPLGAVLGTFLSAYLLSVSGWEAIFIVGGVLPLLVFFALLTWLPESTSFLRLRDKAYRVAPAFPSAAAPAAEGGYVAPASFRTLFSADMAPDTLMLWLSFATVFGAAAAVFYFAPAIMRDHGIPLQRGAAVLGLSGIGSFAGSALAGLLIERFGPGIVLAASFTIGAVATSLIGHAAASIVTMSLDLAVVGFAVNGIGISGVLTLAAVAYPTAVRSTGVGGAVMSGRLGQVIMPLLISTMQALSFQSEQVFLSVGCLLLVGAASIAGLSRRTRARSLASRLAQPPDLTPIL